MFTRAVTFVRSNIPESVVEKAQPFVDQAQGYATNYIERAQTMGTKIHDYAVTQGSTLKERSSTYVNSTAERLDSVLIDQGANKLSTRFLGRELVHFHFKEALEKLHKKNDQEAAAKKDENTSSDETPDDNNNFTKEDKKQAANSIANLFTTITTQVAEKVEQAKETVKARKESLRTAVTDASAKVPRSLEESRELAVKAAAASYALALKSGQYVVVTGTKYVPETVAARAATLKDSTVTFATPYLETANTTAKNLDSKYFKGFAYKFVADVSNALSTTSSSSSASATEEEEDNNKKSFKEVVQEIVEEEQELQEEAQQEQEHEEEEEEATA